MPAQTAVRGNRSANPELAEYFKCFECTKLWWKWQSDDAPIIFSRWKKLKCTVIFKKIKLVWGKKVLFEGLSGVLNKSKHILKQLFIASVYIRNFQGKMKHIRKAESIKSIDMTLNLIEKIKQTSKVFHTWHNSILSWKLAPKSFRLLQSPEMDEKERILILKIKL